MPFAKRIIQPIRLARTPLHASIGDESVYCCDLRLVANGTIVGAVRQLASLVDQAGDIFNDILWECDGVFKRTDKLTRRIDCLSATVEHLDDVEDSAAILPAAASDCVSVVRLRGGGGGVGERPFRSRRPPVCDQFLVSTRPPCVRALYAAAVPSPAVALSSIRHPDGHTAAQWFVVCPVSLADCADATADDDDLDVDDLKVVRRSCDFTRPTPHIRPPRVHARPSTPAAPDALPHREPDAPLPGAPPPACLVPVALGGGGMRGRRKVRRQTVSGAPELLLTEAFRSDEHERSASQDRWLRPRSLVLEPGRSREGTPLPESSSSSAAALRHKDGPLRRSCSFRKSLRSLFGRSRSKSTDLWASGRPGSPGPPVVDLAPPPAPPPTALKRSTSLPRSLKSVLRGSLSRLIGARSPTRSRDAAAAMASRLNDDARHVSRSTSRLGLYRSQSQASCVSRARSMDVHWPRVLEPGPPLVAPPVCGDEENRIRMAVPPDKPWVSSFVDVRLRSRLNHENSRSSSGNWSASSSSARQSLESDSRCFVSSPRHVSQASLDKDSALSLNMHSPDGWYPHSCPLRSSLTSSEDMSTLTGGTSCHNYDSSSSTTITGGGGGGEMNGSVSSLRSRVTPDREASGARGCGAWRGGDPSATNLTQHNLAAHDSKLGRRGVRRYLCDDETSVYSLDTATEAAEGEEGGGEGSEEGARRRGGRKRRNLPLLSRLPETAGRRQGGRKVPPPPPPRVSTCPDRGGAGAAVANTQAVNEVDARLLAKMASITETQHEADQSLSSVDDSVLPSGRGEVPASDGYSTWPRSPRVAAAAAASADKLEGILKSSARARDRPPGRSINFAPTVNTCEAVPEAPSPEHAAVDRRPTDSVSDSGTDSRSSCSSDPSMTSSMTSSSDEQPGVPPKYQQRITVRPGGHHRGTAAGAGTGSTWPRSKTPPLLAAAPAQLIISSPLAGTAAVVQNPQRRSLCSRVSTDDLRALADNSVQEGSLLRPAKGAAGAVEPRINTPLPYHQLASVPTCRRLASQPIYPSLDAMRHSITFPVPQQRDAANCSNYDRTWYDGVRATVGRLPSRSVLRGESGSGGGGGAAPAGGRRRRDSGGSSVSTHSSGSAGRRSLALRASSQQVLTPGSRLQRSSSSCSSGSQSSGSVWPAEVHDVPAAMAVGTTDVVAIVLSGGGGSGGGGGESNDAQPAPTFSSFSRCADSPANSDGSGYGSRLRFEDVPMTTALRDAGQDGGAVAATRANRANMKLYPWSPRPAGTTAVSLGTFHHVSGPSVGERTATAEALTTVAYSSGQPKVSCRVQQAPIASTGQPTNGADTRVTAVTHAAMSDEETTEPTANQDRQAADAQTNDPSCSATSQSPFSVSSQQTEIVASNVVAAELSVSKRSTATFVVSPLITVQEVKSLSNAASFTTAGDTNDASVTGVPTSCASQGSRAGGQSPLTTPLVVVSSPSETQKTIQSGMVNGNAARNTVAGVIASRVSAYETKAACERKSCEAKPSKQSGDEKRLPECESKCVTREAQPLRSSDAEDADKPPSAAPDSKAMVKESARPNSEEKSTAKTSSYNKTSGVTTQNGRPLVYGWGKSSRVVGNTNSEAARSGSGGANDCNQSKKNNNDATKASTASHTPGYMQPTDSSRNAAAAASQRVMAAGRRLLQKKSKKTGVDASRVVNGDGGAKASTPPPSVTAVTLRPAVVTTETGVRILPRIKPTSAAGASVSRRRMTSDLSATSTNGCAPLPRRSLNGSAKGTLADGSQKTYAVKTSFLVSGGGTTSMPGTPPTARPNAAPTKGVKVHSRY